MGSEMCIRDRSTSPTRVSGAFVTTDEPTLTSHNLPRPLGERCWTSLVVGSLHGFWQMSSDVHPPILHHSEQSHCPESAGAPAPHPSLLPSPWRQLLFLPLDLPSLPSLCIWCKSSINYMFCSYFLPVCGVLFSFLNGVF